MTQKDEGLVPVIPPRLYSCIYGKALRHTEERFELAWCSQGCKNFLLRRFFSHFLNHCLEALTNSSFTWHILLWMSQHGDVHSLSNTVILNNGGSGEGSSGRDIQTSRWQMCVSASWNIPKAERERDAEEETAGDGEQKCAAAARIR